MQNAVVCDICGRVLDVHASYVVRIEIFADPSIPPVTSAQLASADHGKELQHLLEEMREMSSEELQDDVHRQFEYRVCRPCQRVLLLNPLGKPRRPRIGTN